jgi:hypothetical protein
MMKVKLENLIALLSEAYQMALEYEGGYSDNFFNATEFQQALAESIENLKNDNYVSEIKKLVAWFSPSCDWDDLVGDEEMGNKVFSELLKIKAVGLS